MYGGIKLSQDLGYLRLGAALPRLRIADVDFNARTILDAVNGAADRDVQVLIFPEMSVTGFTIGDLVHQEALLIKAREGLKKILAGTENNGMIIAVGMPLAVGQRIYNCAVVLSAGKILGVIPKAILPAYREFYEYRWFSPGDREQFDTIELAGQEVLFGTDLLFKIRGIESAILGIEICEELWVPLSPHEFQALAGATVLINLSASNEILGKTDWRRTMVTSESGRCIAAYCYVSSGIGESSNDLVYSGHAVIAENGVILKESERLSPGPQLLISDIDLDRLSHDRRVMTSFNESGAKTGAYRIIETEVFDPCAYGLERKLNPAPFVPRDITVRAQRCQKIFSMQVAALAQKLLGAKTNKLVLGVSGGLDSALALLVAVKTMDFLGLARDNVHTFSLPGFGTTPRTKANAAKLCRTMETNFNKIDITGTSKAHLRDLKHNGAEDIAFENVQARYRTAFLFNKANQINGILLGTGDLTEIALGWCTFAGDHVSHYHVNTSVPKTLVRYLIRWAADEEFSRTPAQKVLYDILDTPISPELRRHKEGQIVQKSEEVIGPVELADFYLYPFVRFGTRPGKILYLANEVRKQGLFEGRYTLEDIYIWSKSFLERFFANQFKRTCLPEGPKVGSVSLSPRGDWRMPSDAVAKLWLDDLEEMYLKLQQ